jgi:hypothetical protein
LLWPPVDRLLYRKQQLQSPPLNPHNRPAAGITSQKDGRRGTEMLRLNYVIHCYPVAIHVVIIPQLHLWVGQNPKKHGPPDPIDSMRLLFSGSFSTRSPLSHIHIPQTPRTTSRNPATRTMASVLNNLFGGKSTDSPDPVQAGGDPGKHPAISISNSFPCHLSHPPPESC